jgi:hypothetical protein
MSGPKGLLEALVGSQAGHRADSPGEQVKAVAWARVSTDMQEERGPSIPEQLRAYWGRTSAACRNPASGRGVRS